MSSTWRHAEQRRRSRSARCRARAAAAAAGGRATLRRPRSRYETERGDEQQVERIEAGDAHQRVRETGASRRSAACRISSTAPMRKSSSTATPATRDSATQKRVELAHRRAPRRAPPPNATRPSGAEDPAVAAARLLAQTCAAAAMSGSAAGELHAESCVSRCRWPGTAGCEPAALAAPSRSTAAASSSLRSGFTSGSQNAFISVPTMRALASASSRTARSVSATRVWSLRETSSASPAR